MNARRIITSTVIAAGIAAAAVTGGTMITAPAAEAASYLSSCYQIAGTANGECYVYYDWWDHRWGAVNHWEIVYGIYNPAWSPT